MDYSTYAALLLLFLAAFIAVGLCASAAMKRRRIQAEQANEASKEPESGWEEIKKVLLGSLHWSDASDAVEPETRSWEEKEVRIAVAEGVMNTPPLWQRRILMGERCEMPKFSGLILYDDRGRPVTAQGVQATGNISETPAAPVITLKDLL